MAGPKGSDRGSLVAAWAKVLSNTGYVATDRAEFHDRVCELVDVLTVALEADAFDPRPVEQVGADLVALRLIAPETLAGTVELIGTYLGPHPRVPTIQAAVTAGFVRAAQARILHEQETLHRSALDARDGAESARRVSEARFRAMFTDAAIGIGISDTRGRLVEVNSAMATMLDYVPEAMLGRYLIDFVHPDDPPDMLRYFQEMVAGQRDNYRIERRFLRRDGSALPTNVTVSLVRDEHGRPQYLVGMVEDTTERHELSEQLRHQANHDHLTGLGNRALFTERLHAAFGGTPGQRVGLCYLDLDGFKAVNDTLGHVIGDQLLIEVGRRLDGLVSAPGRMVARMGGDEFVVLVEHSNGLDELVALAERILAAVAVPVHVAGHRLSTSASIGLVERSVFDASPAETMRDADVTLHWAKVDGKNRWAAYDPERNAREIARITLSTAMPAALEREEFYVDYQPIVSLADGKLLGVEALVRWTHPEFGRLGPDRFIGLAEETGLIVPLGRWVLETSCRQAMKWRAMGASPTVNVNLAARQVAEPGLVDEIAGIIEDVGIPPTSLQLELTESAIMGTTGEPLEALRRLVDLGVRIAIDDFGTGYSNLAYLRHLPVHSLKIAGSFVEGLRAGQLESVDAQIVTALVSLAHTLRLDVIAEGVETSEQADLLRRIGADSAQGWLYAKPGPPEDVERWLT
ncbi:putative bifunctional diguanylate cyclase/phosphodiesterase [Actinophytocola oryzae]|uniref:Diguanylate cyclase/phosphodiesterase with PAS/PAC sensor(S) n=1 Tax=Actinophytocola oryzae TaxID=502181 RepID=A0A4V3FQK2_9PSEU|nr:EAL domain-containing protein [Actinophytocola oryzae]TDV40001.1 diguanylate cyclase/phosphodiesterase with PAS/PAC sensor(s) [Actinophytocola oryzae]